MASVEYGQRCEVCDVERRGSIGGDVSWDMDAETFEMQPMDKKTMAQFRKRAKQMREMPQAEKDKMRKLAMKDREDSLKRKNAESFSASGSGDLTYEGGRMVSIEEVTIVDYNWHTDPDETDDIDEDDIESQVQEKVANEMYDGDSGNESWSYGTDSDGTNVEVYYEWNKTVEDGGEEFIKGW
jgi:hypothetical protein